MLESITLQGFKSFADKTRLEFDGGVCAVIGPNGSGKSNVVEALRWATHQARSRELRAGKATELIFHGSSLKAPLGFAEVQLELRLPTGHLSLSRRLYRDGSSEQDLQGRAVRVRDIHAALRGTGFGPGGLAVIGQGEVSGVVEAQGRTLLGYLQEAAGLSRAVSARQDTQARLQEAERHLHELQRLEEQWQERVTQLAAESERASAERRHRLRSLALQDALHRERQQALEAEIAQLQEQAVAQQLQSEQLAQQITAAQSALEQARALQQRQAADLAAYQQAGELLRAAQEAEEQQRHYLGHLEREAGEVQRDLAHLPQQPPARPQQEPEPLQRELQLTRDQLARLEKSQRQLQAQAQQLSTQAEQHRVQQARLSAQRDTWQQEQEYIQQALAELAPQLTTSQANYSAAQSARQQAEIQQQRQRETRAQADQHLQRLRQQLSAVQSAAAPLQREVVRLGQSLDSYARYGEGPRRALSSDHAGIVGSVADLLNVPAEYEVALQAALGRRLEQVVVQTADDAREIIDLLKRQGGRATFLPLDLLRVRPRRDSALQSRGVLGNLADLCPSDPPQVAQALLSDTLLLSDLTAATALAREQAVRPRLVTLDGELLEPGGALTGGRQRDTGFSVLADQRRYHELQGELEDLARREKALNAEVQAAERTLAELPSSDTTQLSALQAAERQAEQVWQQLLANQRAQQQRLGDLVRQLATLPAAPPTAELPLSDQAQAQAAELAQTLARTREQERQLAEALMQARDQQREWQAYQDSSVRGQQLRERLARNQLATEQQRQQLAHAQQEVARRTHELAALRPPDGPGEQQVSDLSQQYANVLASQNRLRAALEELHLIIARREGSRQPLPDGALLAGTPREWQGELNKLRVLLERIGVVNALAEEEHAQELARLQELMGQRQDAQQAADELHKHLHDLAGAEQRATAEAFERVNAAFGEYSTELLGGSGELEPERGEAGELTGLHLLVQPRGKRTRSLTLLSAGERTMAGLGFLFALAHAAPDMQQRGLPLAVLDEVDAPLDEANIRRFTHFLQVFAARGSQFIVVTHQKATMEVARAIWGVTTDGGGASRLLSIKSE